MFSHAILTAATDILDLARSQSIQIATAESCTAGLISGALTEIAGSSDVVDRGFVTYTNAAKQQMLGVSADSLTNFGAVSAEVAAEMAYGAIINSQADLAVAVTGIAGPGGGSQDKPVGLVWFGLCKMGTAPTITKREFGDIGRSEIRLATVAVALALLREVLAQDFN